MSAWRFVAAFGVVAMLADVVYEGARSVAGPFLGGLGASALAVGVITGVGEAAALLGRLGSGPLADRWGHPWRWTVIGYAVTVAAVPALALATIPLWAGVLIIAERVGKAVRAPAKDALLAHAGSGLGRGKAFAVHEVLDQVGAFAGPLLVAAVVAATGGLRAGFAVLLVPGLAALAVLGWLVRRVPDPAGYEPPVPDLPAAEAGSRLPGRFWRYAAFSAATMAGFATFGLLGYHLAVEGLVATAMVPVVYAAAMAVDAVAAAVSGLAYDRWGLPVVAALPVLAAAVPVLGFTTTPAVAVGGVLVWGAAIGVQESTMRAAVADLIPAGRRATGYGVFAAVTGLAWAAGSTAVGALYQVSYTAVVVFCTVVQAIAVTLLVISSRR
jgi:MFS family permease